MANQSVTGLSNLQISFTHDDGQETEKNLKDTSCLEGGVEGGEGALHKSETWEQEIGKKRA